MKNNSRHIQLAEEAGATGVILVTDGWFICTVKDRRSDSFNFSIPLVCIGTQDAASLTDIIYANLLQNPPKLTFIQFEADPNRLREFSYGAMLAWFGFLFQTLQIFNITFSFTI